MWVARELTQNQLESLRLYYGNHTRKPVAELKRIDIAAELDKGLSILQRRGKRKQIIKFQYSKSAFVGNECKTHVL